MYIDHREVWEGLGGLFHRPIPNIDVTSKDHYVWPTAGITATCDAELGHNRHRLFPPDFVMEVR